VSRSFLRHTGRDADEAWRDAKAVKIELVQEWSPIRPWALPETGGDQRFHSLGLNRWRAQRSMEQIGDRQ